MTLVLPHLQLDLDGRTALCLALCAATWVTYTIIRPKTTVECLPNPAGASWIFGNEETVAKAEPGVMFRQWANELGLTYRIKAAFRAPDVLVLCDPAGIAHMLQKKVYDYHHSKVVRPRIARLLGNGIGWIEGDKVHKRMRNLVGPSLSQENLKAMDFDVRVAASHVIDGIVHDVQGHDGKLRVNLFEIMGKVTLTVVGRVAFLHDFEGGNSPDAEKILSARRAGISPAITLSAFIAAMLLRRFPILNHFPIPAIRAQGFAKEVIQSGVAREMVRRNSGMAGDANPKTSKDLLTRLLIAYHEHKIPLEEVYAQISTFIITGNDTSTQTLSFLIWELARHPDVQERLREELKTFPGEPSFDDLQTKLPYLDAVLKETLRLYPGLPYMERVATKADVIPLSEPVRLSDGRVVSEIPVYPGQVVLVPILSIQRMDSVYKEGQMFNPERWLDGSVLESERQYSGWGHMLVFSDGPRNCIGYRLALLQMKVALVYMMERFKFISTGENIRYKIASSLQAWVVDKPELGPCLPVTLELL
ncbi:cytochrome P450 [Phanerochaete sordida]|uniref:Cytochrome P450 n=1 Tax=Phanerochaete sordida TaxID=48140 RepID=A0A9P3GA04_9APHY|nr:cytochrome P450 [Phanerochaete sordida]